MTWQDATSPTTRIERWTPPTAAESEMPNFLAATAVTIALLAVVAAFLLSERALWCAVAGVCPVGWPVLCSGPGCQLPCTPQDSARGLLSGRTIQHLEHT